MSHNTWNSQASLCITEVVVPSILNCQLQLRQKYYSVYFCPGKPRLKIEKVIDYMLISHQLTVIVLKTLNSKASIILYSS